MADAPRKRVRDIFAGAVELDRSQREAFVREASGGDPEIIEQVNGLLKAYAHAGEFLSSPSVVTSFLPPELPIPGEGPGTVIGPYKILQLIGEGGFGSVYMAEQERPVRRRIALKIIKLGMDTRQVIARFEAERQALAMMDHPNIAKVLDAGATDQGRPYFAMELVRGDRITEHCDRHNVGMRERLELFVQICQAVQHAHQKGIIHRDIKPSNVLVTVADGKPIPKVIDFGIAKATAARLTEKTLFTEFRQLIGTPEYMSPEQADMSGVDIDTRSDIYSLGVLLYELLTGLTPFDGQTLRSAAFGEMQRIIREVEPEKPSTRLHRLGTTLASVAAHRHTNPVELRKQVSGDLDSIVMKCLEKDRTRRYETASGLVRDLDRHLRDEPVEAAPPSLLYRARKFARRHRGPVVASGVIAVAIFIGMGLTILGLVLATAARDRARAAQKAEEVARHEADRERSRANDQAEQLRHELYIAQIVAAQRVLDGGGNEPVKPLLAQCDPDLRGWEWHRMNWLADRSDRTLQGHNLKQRISSGVISFSPVDRRFLTTCEDSSIRVWDADSLQLMQEFSDPDRAVITTAAYSPDGTLIAVGTATGEVHVINAESGQELRTVDADEHWVRCVAIDPTNTRLAIGALPELTIVRNLRTGEREFAFGAEHDLDRASAMQFSADGSRLLIGSLGNAVGVVDMHSGHPLLVERGAGFVVLDAALSPDEGRIASVGQDARLWMRDVHTSRLLYSVSTGASPMNTLTFHPSGDFLACAGDDGVIVFFDAWNGEKLSTLSGHERPLRDVCFDQSGRWLFSLDCEGVVKRWHLGVREPPTAYGDVQGLRAAAYSADGATIYVGAFHQGPIVLNAISFEPSDQMHQPPAFASVGAIAVSPDGEFIAVTGAPASGEPWGVALCDPYGSIRHLRIGTGCAVFSPGSNLVAVCADDHTLSLCDPQSGDSIRKLAIADTSITSVHWGEGDRALIVGCADGTVLQVDAGSGDIIQRLATQQGAIQHVLLTPTHDALVTACIEPPSVKVWEWPSTKLRFTLTDNVHPISIAISPDGRRLIAGGSNKTISLWGVHSGRRITSVGTARATIRAVAFSPDGRTIIACGDDHSLRVWETAAPSSISLERRYLRDAERIRNRRKWLELDRFSEDPTKASADHHESGAVVTNYFD